jgi:cholesterol transport system auxiliary component
MMRRNFLRRTGLAALLVLVLLAPSACSTLSSLESASKPRDVYELSPVEVAQAATSGSGPTLFVSDPTASGAIATDRVAVKPGGLQVTYLADARWIDPATVHFQQLLARSVSGLGRFGYVTYSSQGPLPDYTLLTDIEAFQAEIAEDRQSARVVTRAHLALVRESDGRVISRRRFSAQAIAADDSTAAIMPAFETATQSLLREIVNWLAGAPARVAA